MRWSIVRASERKSQRSLCRSMAGASARCRSGSDTNRSVNMRCTAPLREIAKTDCLRMNGPISMLSNTSQIEASDCAVNRLESSARPVGFLAGLGIV